MSERHRPVPRRSAGVCIVGVVVLLAAVLAADRWTATDDAGGATWSVTVGSGMSGYCAPSDDQGRRCEVEVPVEPMDPEERCYVDPEGELADLADVEACLQRLVDDGVVGADVLAEHRCTAAYESLPVDVSDDEYAKAGEAFERCMVAAAEPVPSSSAPTG
jgi:hypothetical protein